VDGQLEQLDGERWRLRFSRRLPHPVDVVWRAITEPEQLKAWFPDGVTGDWQVGATLTFGPAHGPSFTGEVLAVDPPKSLEFTWGTDQLRFTIEPEADGCVLTLTDTIDEVGKAVRDSAGWHVCLDKLEHSLDGTEPTWDDGERWKELNPQYAAAFGPEAATIGPPAEWEAELS
jgi:uncharacterized protein YndB with AHSA1/START domain